jgi:hypothetical protein
MRQLKFGKEKFQIVFMVIKIKICLYIYIFDMSTQEEEEGFELVTSAS